MASGLFSPVPEYVIRQLSDKPPDFKGGRDEHGLAIEELAEFGPAELSTGMSYPVGNACSR